MLAVLVVEPQHGRWLCRARQTQRSGIQRKASLVGGVMLAVLVVETQHGRWLQDDHSGQLSKEQPHL